MAEEEVHGGVEARVQPDEQDDEQVTQHCGQVHAQEQSEEHALLLWPDGESQEEELGHAALIFPPHAPLLSAGNEKTMKEAHFDCSRQLVNMSGSVCIALQKPLR